MDARTLLLGLAAGGTGLALLLLAASAGIGPGAFFPLLVLWLVVFTLLAKGAQRLLSRRG